MQMNETIENFYLSVLNYSGIKIENDVFVNKDPKLGEITIDDRNIALPYYEILKNPNKRVIFHPLNENYVSPETTMFMLLKRRMILELNLRLSSLIVSLFGVAGDVKLQQRIKSSELIRLVSGIGEVDLSVIETLIGVSKASKKTNEEAFLFDIFLKKNGEVNGTPYSAIGKINFNLYNEINRALADGEYKVFGKKCTKKDLLALANIFQVIFPAIETPDAFTEGTDNKVFRYLNILLKTSYQIAARINSLVDLMEELDEPSLNLEEIRTDLSWVNSLEKLYSLTSEIRLIPNQTDITVETSKMQLDESKVANATTSSPPAFDPSRSAQPQQMQQQQQPQQQMQPQQQQMMPQQQQQMPQPLSPEDIIRGSLGGGMQPMMPQMMPMMQPMQQQQVAMPQWMIQEQMRNAQGQQMQQMPQMQQMMPMQQQAVNNVVMTPQGPMVMTPQGMVPAQLMQQQMPQQQMMPMMQQGMPMGMQMMPMQPQQQGIAINPLFAQRTVAPFN